MVAENTQPVRTRRVQVGAPPMPHEHGAWVMLYAPMLLAFAVARPAGWAPALLLALAVTGAYLARHPADLLLRGKGDAGSAFWTAVYCAIAAGAAAPLLLAWHASALLLVGAVAGVLFGVHAVLLSWPSKRRMDRSVYGEVLAVLGLTLSAPAAVVLSRGTIDGLAWCLWAACALFFGSSVFHVKMLLAGAKQKGQITGRVRWRLGAANLAYHAAVAAVTVVDAYMVGARGLWVIAAYAPIVIRALWGVARLSRRLPPLKRVGLLESAYAVWFVVAFAAALAAR